MGTHQEELEARPKDQINPEVLRLTSAAHREMKREVDSGSWQAIAWRARQGITGGPPLWDPHLLCRQAPASLLRSELLPRARSGAFQVVWQWQAPPTPQLLDICGCRNALAIQWCPLPVPTSPHLSACNATVLHPELANQAQVWLTWSWEANTWAEQAEMNLFDSHCLEGNTHPFYKASTIGNFDVKFMGTLFGKSHADMFILLAVRMSKYACWVPSFSLHRETLPLKKSDTINTFPNTICQTYINPLFWACRNWP